MRINNFKNILTRCYSSSANKNVFVEKLTGNHEKIAILGLNKPSTKNALGITFPSELTEAIEEIHHDNSIWAVILRSFVPGAFCSGLDLKDVPKLAQQDFLKHISNLRSSFTRIEKLPMPVIAAIDGFALGGGLELTLPCDFRIAADNAKCGQLEAKLGLFPAAGGSQRLPRLVGPARAKEISYLASVFDAAYGEKIGLFNHVVPQNESGDSAYRKSLEFAEQIVSNAPIAIRMTKISIDRGLQVDITTGLSIEEACASQIATSKDALEGVMAAVQKRKPIFKGE